MRKCDFCKNELTCSGVNRSECIVRDFYNFEAERTPADDVTTITRLIMECQPLDPVAIAKYLVQNGVSTKSQPMKNVLSYINRPLFGAEIKSWIAENTKQNTEYSRIARSMLRYMNLRNDCLYLIVTSPPGSASGKRNTGKPIVVRAKERMPL